MKQQLAALFLGLLISPAPIAEGLTRPHPTHPGIEIHPDGFWELQDPREAEKRDCMLVEVASEIDLGPAFCTPGLAMMRCVDPDGRKTADMHWWTQTGGLRCHHEVETYTEAQLRGGVVSHGIQFYWSPSDKPGEASCPAPKLQA